MDDDIYSSPGSSGFQAFINQKKRITILQNDYEGDCESVELTAEEAEELAGYLLKLAKRLKKIGRNPDTDEEKK